MPIRIHGSSVNGTMRRARPPIERNDHDEMVTSVLVRHPAEDGFGENCREQLGTGDQNDEKGADATIECIKTMNASKAPYVRYCAASTEEATRTLRFVIHGANLQADGHSFFDRLSGSIPTRMVHPNDHQQSGYPGKTNHPINIIIVANGQKEDRPAKERSYSTTNDGGGRIE